MCCRIAPRALGHARVGRALAGTSGVVHRLDYIEQRLVGENYS